MLWEHEPQASVSTAFSNGSLKLSLVFLQLDRNTENTFSISFRKYRDEEKEKQLVYFDHQNVNSLCSRHTSTARASSVFLSSFSINLLAFYHEGRSLIGYATHVLFCDR